MDTRYVPAAHEGRLFERWLAAGVFGGGSRPDRETYAIALPPPNVTGELHMGHALNGSTQDTLIRLKRMQGMDTLWICGTDHASIAVHAVIERQLRAEGLTRWDLGRERFLERVWQWRAETGATIIQQFKRLGATLDYDHERFTMDERYVQAVLTMFVELYRKGYIYRDNRLINWCPTCASTISDLEVRYEHAADTLFEVRYPIKGTNDFLHVATVRPETILADTAVAVHPERRALPAPGGGHGDRAAGEPRGADHRGRVRAHRLRHRRTQGDARPRPQRLRDRPPARPPRADGDRLRRPHDRAGRRVRRDAGRGGPRSHPRCPGRPAADRRRGALRARGGPLRPHRRPHRAADLAAVVHAHGRARPAGQRGGALWSRALPPEEPGEHLLQLDGQPAPVVHLAPALVGPSDPGLVLPGRPSDGRPGRAGGLRRRAARASWSATRTCWTRGSRRRCGRLPPSAGRSATTTGSTASTRATSSPPTATSSTSGWPAC